MTTIDKTIVCVIIKLDYYKKLGGKMESNTKTLIIDGKLINLEKTPIEDLEKIQKDLEKREKEITKQIEKALENY